MRLIAHNFNLFVCLGSCHFFQVDYKFHFHNDANMGGDLRSPHLRKDKSLGSADHVDDQPVHAIMINITFQCHYRYTAIKLAMVIK